MVPTLPVTPGPAAAGPLTGGQYVAHEPLQFDLDEVSGPNQYTVKPFALVSTFTPLIVAVFSAVPDAAAAGLEAALDELLPGLLVLADADPALGYPLALGLLEAVARVIQRLPNRVTIAGHTSATAGGGHHRIRIT